MREKVSALLDGELGHGESDAMLDAVGRDPELADAWHLYHLIRAIFRNEPIHPMGRLPDQIRDRIRAADDPPPARIVPLPRNWRRWTPGLALAASFAAAIAVGSVLWTTNSADDADQLRARAGEQPAARVVARATKWDAATPELEDELNAFLVEHGEFTPMSSMNGLATYAKFVSYDSSK